MQDVFQNLQTLVITFVFNPVLLAFLVACYFVGRWLGKYIPRNIVNIMLWIFLALLVAQMFLVQRNYEFTFLIGIPFMGGLWQGARKWSY